MSFLVTDVSSVIMFFQRVACNANSDTYAKFKVIPDMPKERDMSKFATWSL